jgi:DNA-binding MltR family transcriptional regulator
MSNKKEVAKKEDKEKTSDKQWNFLLEQFQKESDRAAVILVVSIIDENLETLLKSYLVPNPTANDSLFDSATSALSNFSSKIDMAYRIGLISGKFARDLHIVRKIRNSFAHDIYGCNFQNGSVLARIRELENSFHNDILEVIERIDRNDNLLKGIRGKFIYMSSHMIWSLTDLIEEVKEIKERSTEHFYNELLEDKE